MQVNAPNRIYIRQQSVLYTGVSFDFTLHAHHAVQLCLGLKGTFEIEAGPKGKRYEVCAALISPDVPHRILATDQPLLFIYLDPESLDYSRVLEHATADSGFLLWTETDNALFSEIEALLDTAAGKHIDSVIEKIFAYMDIETNHGKTIDSRIQKVLTALNQSLDGQCSAAQLEQVSGLSASRLQHLFKQDVGIPIRRYSLWLRIRKVVLLSQTGDSLTQAALAAGFSDSAHFSRIFKQMFGLAPTILLSTPRAVTITLCDAL